MVTALELNRGRGLVRSSLSSYRITRWQQFDEDLTYTARQLDREVVAKDQIGCGLPRPFHEWSAQPRLVARQTGPQLFFYQWRCYKFFRLFLEES